MYHRVLARIARLTCAVCRGVSAGLAREDSSESDGDDGGGQDACPPGDDDSVAVVAANWADTCGLTDVGSWPV